MGGKGKQFKGQLQTVDGSFVGEAIITCKFAYDPDTPFSLEFSGQAKSGTQENQFLWHINSYTYNDDEALTSVLTASNTLTTKGTQLTIDTTHSATESLLTIVGGTFGFLDKRDKVTVKINTATNTAKTVTFVEKLSNLQIVVLTADLADETSTAITDLDLLTIFGEGDKNEHSRRAWLYRENYIYE